MLKPWKFVLLAVPCLVSGLGCVSEALKYNNDIAAVTKELESLGKEFGTQIVQNKGNSAKLKEVHAEVLRRCEPVIQRGRKLTPPDTAEGKRLYQSFLAFLDVEDDILRNDFGKVIRQLGNNNIAGLQSTLKSIASREEAQLQHLRTSQTAFAKANNFRIQ